MALDTLSIANRIKAAERDGRVAEEIATLFREVEDDRLQRLVTREDFQREFAAAREEGRIEFERVRAESRAEFEKVRVEFEKVRLEIQQAELRLRYDLTLRLGGIVAAGVALLGGLNVFF